MRGSRSSDRPDSNQRLDRTALIHRGVRLRDAVEVGFVVECASGVDATLENIVEQVGDVPAHRGDAAPQPDVSEDHRVDRHLDVVGRADCAHDRAGTCDRKRGRHRLAGTNALERGVDPDPVCHLHDGLVCLLAALSEDVGGAELAGNSLASRVRLRAMILSAPSREEARMAQSPTAPSPITATTSPGLTPALTAAWWPVHMTSERLASERSVSPACPEPGTRTSVASAKGTRTASPCPPSTPWFPNEPPWAQFDGHPARQCGQVPSQNVNGAITRSPRETPRTSDPMSSTTPMNSWPIGPSACRESPR